MMRNGLGALEGDEPGAVRLVDELDVFGQVPPHPLGVTPRFEAFAMIRYSRSPVW